MPLSYGTALSGLTATTVAQDVTAHSIANISNPDSKARRVIQSEAPSLSGTYVSSIQTIQTGPDPAQDMVDLMKNRNTYSANLKLINVQDRMTGELIDILS